MIRAERLPGGSQLYYVTMLGKNHAEQQGTENDGKNKTMAATNSESTSV